MNTIRKIFILIVIIAIGCNVKELEDSPTKIIDTDLLLLPKHSFYSRNSDSIKEYLKNDFSLASYVVVNRGLNKKWINNDSYYDSILVVKEDSYWIPKLSFDDSCYYPFSFSKEKDTIIYFGKTEWYCKNTADTFTMQLYDNIYRKYWYKLFKSPITDYFYVTMSFFPDINHIAFLSKSDYKVKQDANKTYVFCDSIKEYISFDATMFQLYDSKQAPLISFYLVIEENRLISEYYHLPVLDIVVDYLYFENEDKQIYKMLQMVCSIPRFSDTISVYSGFNFGNEYIKIKKDCSNRFE